MELVEKPYTEWQADLDGNMRNVWIFPLKSAGEPDNHAENVLEKEIIKCRIKS